MSARARGFGLTPRSYAALTRGSPAAPGADAANHATLETARRLLAEGVRPRSVAGQVGYAHLSSFSLAFTRRYGASPRTFQRHHSGATFPPVTASR